MGLHHIFTNDDVHTFCPYCKIEIPDKKWASVFESLTHYKMTTCGCGKSLSFKVGFHGSGHDQWKQPPTTSQKLQTEPTIKTLEEKLKIIEQKGHS